MDRRCAKKRFLYRWSVLGGFACLGSAGGAAPRKRKRPEKTQQPATEPERKFSSIPPGRERGLARRSEPPHRANWFRDVDARGGKPRRATLARGPAERCGRPPEGWRRISNRQIA